MNDTDSVETDELRNAPMPNRSAMAAWLLGVVVFVTAGLSVLGLAGRHGWLLDLCNHFRFQYALLLGVTTIGLALLRSRRVVWVSLAGLILNSAFIVPLYLGGANATAIDKHAPALRVMHFNINTGNTNEAGVIREILASDADVVFVQEVNRRWADALDQEMNAYQQIVSDPRSDNFGIACYVRVDDPSAGYHNPLVVETARSFDPTAGVSQVPAIELVGTFAGEPIALLSIHPLPPVSAEYARSRNATLRAAGAWAAEQASPCVVVGDFNATPWSAAFRALREEGELVNSQHGFGRAASWPAGALPLGMIPIDHLLHSEALVTADRRLGAARGSDHLPLVVELAWRGGS